MPERRYLVTVAKRPPKKEASELLELILAAACLDLPVLVVLCGDGVGLIEGASAAAWLQLVEQGLAELAVLGGPAGEQGLPCGVRRIDPAALEAARLSSVEIRA